MNARRHEAPIEEGAPESHVTHAECKSRWWCGWLKWGVMLTVFGGLIVAAVWLFTAFDSLRGVVHAQDGRLQVEETKSEYVKRDLGEIKDTLKSMDTEIKAIRTEQAAFFGKSK